MEISNSDSASLTAPIRAPRRHHPSRLWSAVKVLTISVIWAVIFLELALRLIVHPPSEWYNQLRAADPATYFANASNIHTRFKEADIDFTFTTNAQGLREDRVVGPVEPGTERLLAVGDSFTYGQGVGIDETFVRLLNGAQTPEGLRIDAVNGGVGGYGTDNEAAWLHTYGWPLQPKIVLLGFFTGNDVCDVMRSDSTSSVDAAGQAQFTVTGPRQITAAGTKDSPLVSWLTINSRAFEFLRGLGQRLPLPRDPHDPENLPCDVIGFRLRNQPPALAEGWQRTTGFLDAMQQDALAHGARLVVVVIPTRYEVEPDTQAGFARQFGLQASDIDWDLAERKMRDWSAAAGVPIVDLLPRFQAAAAQTRLYYPEDGHWTAAGHRLAAQGIREELVRLGLLAP